VTVIEPGYIESEMTAKAETTSLMVDNKTGTKAMVDAIEREPGRGGGCRAGRGRRWCRCCGCLPPELAAPLRIAACFPLGACQLGALRVLAVRRSW